MDTADPLLLDQGVQVDTTAGETHHEQQEEEEGRPGFAGQHRFYLHVSYLAFQTNSDFQMVSLTGSSVVTATTVTRATMWPAFQIRVPAALLAIGRQPDPVAIPSVPY